MNNHHQRSHNKNKNKNRNNSNNTDIISNNRSVTDSRPYSTNWNTETNINSGRVKFTDSTKANHPYHNLNATQFKNQTKQLSYQQN